MTTRNAELIDRDLTGIVIGAFYAVYNGLGFGFLESVYVSALVLELTQRGLKVDREMPVRVYYSEQPIALFKVDLLVETRLVIEVKASKVLVESDRKQLYNYLRSTDLQLGLLLHFGPKPTFVRVVSTGKQHQSAPLPLNPPHPR